MYDLVLLGNYAQTGHFGGPLAYTPYNVATHLAAPISVDCASTTVGRSILTATSSCSPAATAFQRATLWMLMGQALARKYEATGNKRYYVDPHVAILPIDALGFRRGAGAMKTLLQDHGPRRSSALRAGEVARDSRARGACREHRRHQRRQRRTVRHWHRDRGRQSGVLGRHGRGIAAPKVIAFEGEFAMTEGHAAGTEDAGAGAQGRQAIARDVLRQQRRHRRFADRRRDRSQCDGYRLIDQWTSYGWNVFVVQDGNAYDQVVAARKAMEVGSGGSPAHDGDRQDHEGILAGGG